MLGLSSYSPHGAVRILFSFLPQLSFLGLWLCILGLVYFMVLGLPSHFELFLPFLEKPLFLGFFVVSVFPQASYCSLSGSCPCPHSDRV